MQLKIRRSQRTGGVIGNTIFFCLDVRAEYSSAEQNDIRRYRLGGEVIYNSSAARKHLDQAGAHLDRTQSGGVGERAGGLARGVFSLALAKMQLNVSIASLGKGHHIECKDLGELLEAEDTVRTACKGVTRFLEAAATFDGSETVIEYDRGEERVHIAQNAPPLLEYRSDTPQIPELQSPVMEAPKDPIVEMGQDFGRVGKTFKTRWLALEQRIMAYAASKGWKVDENAIRVTAFILAFVLFFLLVQIL